MLCVFTLKPPVTRESREMHKENLLKIGELSRVSHLSVRTIRYYSDIGILPPTLVTEAGFRYYSTADAARLELIRSLRGAGFAIKTIKNLLKDNQNVSTVITVQLSEIEANIQHLQQQKTLLQRALGHGDDHALSYLQDARALADMDFKERQHFLDRHLLKAFDEIPTSVDWKSKLWLWQDGILTLPKQLKGHQLKPWLELAELVLDECFSRRLNRMGQDSWKHQWSRRGADNWKLHHDHLLSQTLNAAQQGEQPTGVYGQELVRAYVSINADLMDRHRDATFPHFLLELIENMADARFDRYWELIGCLKGVSSTTMWCKYQARGWLIQGLKWQLAQGRTSTL
jgi:DNA-binding transcriptional MerR regulator